MGADEVCAFRPDLVGSQNKGLYVWHYDNRNFAEHQLFCPASGHHLESDAGGELSHDPERLIAGADEIRGQTTRTMVITTTFYAGHDMHGLFVGLRTCDTSIRGKKSLPEDEW
jgi:hypothetical protein